jgi:hypothetical protein
VRDFIENVVSAGTTYTSGSTNWQRNDFLMIVVCKLKPSTDYFSGC